MSWWRLGEGTGYRGGNLALHEIECAFCNERGNWTLVFHEEKRKASSQKEAEF
jgi:hypothetical protein